MSGDRHGSGPVWDVQKFHCGKLYLFFCCYSALHSSTFVHFQDSYHHSRGPLWSGEDLVSVASRWAGTRMRIPLWGDGYGKDEQGRNLEHGLRDWTLSFLVLPLSSCVTGSFYFTGSFFPHVQNHGTRLRRVLGSLPALTSGITNSYCKERGALNENWVRAGAQKKKLEFIFEDSSFLGIFVTFVIYINSISEGLPDDPS